MHLNEDDLVLHYYGEMPAADERRAAAHLGECAACQRQFTRLQQVMTMVESAPGVEPAAGFEQIAWARLEPAIGASRRGWLSWLVFSPARLAFAAGIIVLIGAAFMAGRITRGALPAGAGAPQTAQSAQQVRERILLVDLGDHLDRSQMVLVELASAGGGTGQVDISTERARAEQLVAVNRLYRQTALSTGDANMASLLDDLERVLVDIAASPATVSQEDLDSVRRRIDSKELLFKVRVVSSQVRERQKAAIQERTPRQTLGS
jgi:hypothetical protein